MPNKSIVQVMAVELLDGRHWKDKCVDSKFLPSRSIKYKMQHGTDIKHFAGLYTSHLTLSWRHFVMIYIQIFLIAQEMGLIDTLIHSLSLTPFLSFILMVLFGLSCLIIFHSCRITA